ncbi:YkgJ family cysteine cluster protein [Pseudomonas guariconensis]|uniref:YkgJ family cysteine cluster protein n=1 Tax=Pseudomonas TaxID=286 RepID=UPI001CE4AA2A|nr:MULTISPECIES: YkgJ family cysteine cluster protein [Pseudomonas]MCO7637311.1 YkgJ family cysteine cluster protein [Pseudomonas sp. S 311-6]MCO7517035.1 YkgJ family cysteine cluster protein [Pseudomonas putida]MCO7566954.1 YkgJ family cysteine cluster protein [Pseudomonas mosselii]MCO7607416.1 YkgJ family cysteine cluster protein [Pseudomonas guariconensis]MCO7618273.1 YkgJ family cysteine cluster protein [Pseudomonas guariconensis]
MDQHIRFACTGCGKCCTGHHVPLTLAESRQWAAAGGQVVVLIEAFVTDGPGMPSEQREHVLRRSYPVACGTTEMRVSVTFAAFNPGRCRNLDANDLCTIYETRPLVCRIYPAEINPHLPLRPENKDCPPEAWEQGPALIHGNLPVDPQLMALIEASRQADRDDIAAKVVICQALGMTTSALKGNGFTAWLPDTGAFASALEQEPSDQGATWALHVQDPALVEQLHGRGLRTIGEAPLYYAFIGF